MGIIDESFVIAADIFDSCKFSHKVWFDNTKSCTENEPENDVSWDA
jgi:hypothetical protein